MIIKPIRKATDNEDIVPVHVRLQSRADLLALMLRIIRYFFQQGLVGLKWTDDHNTTDIFIEDSFMENPEEDNMFPSIIISMGGATLNPNAMMQNIAQYNLNNRVIFTHQTTSFNMEIRGRNKLETFKISEGIGAIMFLLKDEILKHATDIEDISGISMSPVNPVANLVDGQNNLLGFKSNVSFSIFYKLEFNKVPLGSLFTTAIFAPASESRDGESTHTYEKMVYIPETEINDSELP